MSPRILFLTHAPPLPAVSGERIRSASLIKGLAATGWTVSLFSLDPDRMADRRERRELAKMCEFVAIEPIRVTGLRRSARLLRDVVTGRPFQLRYFYDRGVADHLRMHLAETTYDVVQICQLYMYDYLPKSIDVPVVFDSVNVEARRLASISRATPATARGLVARTQIGVVRRLERDVARRAAVVLTVSDEEARHFRADPAVRVAVVPNGVDVESWPDPVQLTREPVVLLMGSLSYSANVDSVTHFLGDIAPHVRHATVRVTVLGMNPPSLVRKAAARSAVPVEVTGYVESTRPHLHASRVLAVPLRHGAGTRLKILEALAAGVPVVSTSVGCDGLGLVHEREITIADDPQDFAAWIDRLLVDDALCARLAYAGREAVRQRYDWRTIAAGLDEVLRRVLSDGAANRGLASAPADVLRAESRRAPTR